MAVGANERFWETGGLSGLPKVFKHDLLNRYLPVFLIRTSSAGKRAAYFDGYAGRGKYDNGSLGSPGYMLEFAVRQLYSRNTTVSLYLCEKDPESYHVLEELAARYRMRKVDVHTKRDDATGYLRDSLVEMRDVPAFMFLDPCGVGIPFEDLVNGMNRADRKGWPPTESMINFSLEAVRRIGGHVASADGNEKTMAVLDTSLGGDWWRAEFEHGVNDVAVDRVVRGFMQRLASETRAVVVSVPVRRSPRQRPIYHLVFSTRHPGGVWNFGHCTAKATETWWAGVESAEEETTGQFAMFGQHPSLTEVEQEAVPVIADNIARLTATMGEVRLGDHAIGVFGQYFGRVRESAARDAVKLLYADGRSTTTGVGGKVEALRVMPGVGGIRSQTVPSSSRP